MNITLKNIFKTIPLILLVKTIPFLFLIKMSFTILFFVAYARTVANMDASHPWQIGFQDPATPIMEGIIFFNGLLMAFMIFIACLVGWLLYKSLTLFNEAVHVNPTGFTHSTLLEVVWTIIPAGILMIISIPSYNLLYAMDEVIDPSLTIKVVGHQWYWSYECSDFEVPPTAQKENGEFKDLAERTQETLSDWYIICKGAGVEVGLNEKQTQITLVKELLDFLANNNNVKHLSEELYEMLAKRLNLISMLLIRNEVRKESHGPLEEFTQGELLDILSDTKNKLEKSSFIPEEQDLVIKILKTFKQLLRITANLESDNVKKELLSPLSNLKSSSQGSDSSTFSDSDDDNSDDDDGQVVTDLMDFDKSNPYWEWCELLSVEKEYDNDDFYLKKTASEALLSERTCNNAAFMPEKDDATFSKLLEKMNRDKREFRKAIPIADLSENKLIDTQLIEHQLRLTRAEREGLSSEFAWDSAVVGFNFAEFEYNNALTELNSAKLHLHWSNIELMAANVNKLSAEYLQADASLGVTDPLLIRGLWINRKGYYSWNDFLRLASKKLSDAEKLVFLRASEELNGANFLLGKAQISLTSEELNKSNAIADNAKAEFMAMEREVIPAVEEFMRGQTILANAKSELKTFQDISERAIVRYEKAQNFYEQADRTWQRWQSRLNAAEAVYKNAIASLKTPEPVDTEELTRLCYDKMNRDILNNAKVKVDNLKKSFDEAVLNVQSARSDLVVAEDRVKTVNINLKKTERVFDDTGLLEKQTPVKGKPVEYYHNFCWEIHNEDTAFVNAQLKTDLASLKAAKIRLNEAESKLKTISGELMEAELKSYKVLINLLENNNGNEIPLNTAKNHLSGIELRLSRAIYDKALVNFELENSAEAKLILDRANKGLLDAKLNSTDGYLGSIIENNPTPIDADKLISDYSDNCLKIIKKELSGADADYVKASSILNEAKGILERVTADLSLQYDNPYLETLKTLHKKTVLSLKNRIEELNSVKEESSVLDIKLEPGLLESKSYKEVLLAKAELANIKWLCARVAKTLDILLPEEVKPFNVQFSHLKSDDFFADTVKSDDLFIDNSTYSLEELDNSDDSPANNINNSSENSSADDGSGDKKRKVVKDILSNLKDKKPDYTSAGLQQKISEILAGLSQTLDNKEFNELMKILDKAYSSMISEEMQKNKEIETQITNIKVEVNSLEAEEEGEDIGRINFDSYLIADEDLVIPEVSGKGKAGTVFRLLEVDNRLFVPTNTHIRVLVTSADVLHSWAVPSLGVKVDACPGRLNQVFLFVKREGVFYGQCSELCGVNHGFMPIVVQAVSQDEYLTWVGKRLCS